MPPAALRGEGESAQSAGGLGKYQGNSPHFFRNAPTLTRSPSPPTCDQSRKTCPKYISDTSCENGHTLTIRQASEARTSYRKQHMTIFFNNRKNEAITSTCGSKNFAVCLRWVRFPFILLLWLGNANRALSHQSPSLALAMLVVCRRSLKTRLIPTQSHNCESRVLKIRADFPKASKQKRRESPAPTDQKARQAESVQGNDRSHRQTPTTVSAPPPTKDPRRSTPNDRQRDFF